ncbi:hypothetical protein IKE_05888 [Bacillus cereus VD196]|uniref:Lipoprotein n=1 Tax=Bacillus cereus VD196 TaxID=1053243 RepID=A0A9W5PYG0_BACCE|nr:hypothetical protein [Bacillus cereus]EJR93397.1 hypothetical protein IKG_05513 [Bacillus cereus VD200]EOO61614.1 hypothetical protein IKE_05888 [Bacillus cereus VD196]
MLISKTHYIILTCILILGVLAACGKDKTIEDVKPVEKWENSDKDVTKEEFKEMTKNNNSMGFEKNEIKVYKQDSVQVTTNEQEKTYYVADAYLPIEEAKRIQKDKPSMEELLVKYSGAAQEIIENEKEKEIKVTFVTGPQGYELLSVKYKDGKLKDINATF